MVIRRKAVENTCNKVDQGFLGILVGLKYVLNGMCDLVFYPPMTPYITSYRSLC